MTYKYRNAEYQVIFRIIIEDDSWNSSQAHHHRLSDGMMNWHTVTKTCMAAEQHVK